MRRIDSILGNSQRLDGGAMFGNAPRAMWETWSPPDEHNRIALACRSMLVSDGDRRVLFEAGIGAFFEPKLRERFGIQESTHVLLTRLDAMGVAPESIDAVVLSHLHFDHAGGLLTAWSEDRETELAFPNATFVVGREAWERAQKPHPRDRASFVPHLNALLEASGRLQLVDSATDVAGLSVRFHPSSGHTPGMLCAEIEMPDGPVVFAADLIPGRPWVRRAITMGYDRFPELLIDEKAQLLDDLLERNGRLFFTHDPDCALCTIRRDDRGRITVGETWGELEALNR